MSWFVGILTAVRRALHEIWSDHRHIPRREDFSDYLMTLHIDPRDWQFAWKDGASHWQGNSRGVLYAGLALSFGVEDAADKEAYDAWFERSVLEELREMQPDCYAALVKHLIETLDRMDREGVGDE
jgi:hypothetical protein